MIASEVSTSCRYSFSDDSRFVSFNSSCDLELFKHSSFITGQSSSHERTLFSTDTVYFNFTNNGLLESDTLAIRFLPRFQKLAIMNGVFKLGSKTVTNDGFVTITLEQPYPQPTKGDSKISHSYKIEFLSSYVNIYANGKDIYSINYLALSEDPHRFVSGINGFTTSADVFWRKLNCRKTHITLLGY